MNEAVEISTGRAAESGHWYTSTGDQAYQIKAKAGHMRPVTLRDARKLGLFPSVTGILSCAAKPQLERWKIEQAMMACLTLPRVEWENENEFMARELEDSKVQAQKARERGTAIHAAIEQSFTNYAAVEPELMPYVRPVRDWLDSRFGAIAWQAEKSFSSIIGYGGKVDLYSREAGGVVLDFKTKDLTDASKAKGYDEQGIQLAAYARGLGLDSTALRINLFVSSVVPGLVVPVEWLSESFDRHWTMFQALLDYWCADRGYYPSGAA